MKNTNKTFQDVILEGLIFGVTTTLALTIIASLLIAFINLIH